MRPPRDSPDRLHRCDVTPAHPNVRRRCGGNFPDFPPHRRTEPDALIPPPEGELDEPPTAAAANTHDPRWSPEGLWEGRELPEGTHGRVVDPALLYAKER
jgi:hypothetical protein